MLTKADFQQKIADSITLYPAVATLYQAGDPRILQSLDAMAAMLSLMSSQMEVAKSEPFEQVRDSTVLANAAMRGVIRKATPGRVRVTAKNNNATAFTVETGRVIMDSVGRPYIIESSLILAAGATGTFDATQIKHEAINHTITGSVPFYAITIPEATDDTYLCGIAISDSFGDYEYRERYVNTWPGDRVFHVEIDDRQVIYARFGQEGVVGVQPLDGNIFTLTVSRTSGEISIAAGSPFSFEYLLTPQESAIDLTLSSLLTKGQNPPDMATLRDLVNYPSTYDHNAVYLGEFDFVVRKTYPSVKFLSVWNESVEEAARGANVDNINTLFVAVLSQDGTETVLTEPNPAAPVAPTVITTLTDTQTGIKNTILAADNGYRVRFITPVRSKIAVTIAASVSTSYVASDVQAKIIEAILAEYGEEAAASKRGSSIPLYRLIYSLLKEKVPALSDGKADIRVTVADTVGNLRPELWRYVATDSLTVTVSSINIILPSWGR
ncbi:MAG: hypothetical protein WC856_02240 [Methylococcaceae bacterium]|jgi:hypothetical protein